ncbi:MAG: hypothetical protein UV33_C0002G0004 [Candidatus Daviesbacteria bacterium GW2011_GWA1_42_6]|nr:MAG: hypothetical protein UV33_C0002G0004 [Candidatus Daviesbacteria bacterium GW2011_GWA1_42_6]
MTKNFGDIPSFFLSMQSEYAFYRPLSRETFNLIMYKVFGLNPLPFHIVNFGFILSNIYLVYKLMGKIVKDKSASFLAALVYAVSSIHSIELFYLASVQTLLASFFMLLSIIFYINFRSQGNNFFFLPALLAFILGLASHETAIVLPGVLILIILFLRKKGQKIVDLRLYLPLLPFLLTGAFYLLSTSLLSGMPEQKVYQPIFSIKGVINSLSWYTLWSFGMSEIFADFIGPKFSIHPSLMKYYGQYTVVSVAMLGILLSILAFLSFQVRKVRADWRPVILFGLSFIFALFPFLFFPQHKSSYYLTFSTVWFSSFLASILFSGWRISKLSRLTVILFLIIFGALSYQTVKLNHLTYWAAKRAPAAKYILSDIKITYPHPGKGSIFYIKDDPEYPFIAKEWGSSSKQAFYILSGSDALKLLYLDPTIRVYFEGMGIPLDADLTKAIQYTAKFPY